MIPESDSESEDANFVQEESTFMTMPEALNYAHFVTMESWESALTTALTTTTTALHTTAKSAYPKSYAEAMTRPDAQLYHEAACKEIDALLENGTWGAV